MQKMIILLSQECSKVVSEVSEVFSSKLVHLKIKSLLDEMLGILGMLSEPKYVSHVLRVGRLCLAKDQLCGLGSRVLHGYTTSDGFLKGQRRFSISWVTDFLIHKLLDGEGYIRNVFKAIYVCMMIPNVLTKCMCVFTLHD